MSNAEHREISALSGLFSREALSPGPIPLGPAELFSLVFDGGEPLPASSEAVRRLLSRLSRIRSTYFVEEV